MKFLYVHYLVHAQALKGGPRVHIENSTRALRTLGHDVQILASGNNGSPAGRRKLSRPRRWLARYGYQLREYLRSLKGLAIELSAAWDYAPDVIIARYEAFHFSIALVARLLRIPLIWEVNSTLNETRRWNTEVYIYPGSERCEAVLLKTGAAVFAVSEQLKRLLVAEGLPARAIAVVPNGADPDLLRPRERDARLCRRFGLRSEYLVVGFFGSFFGWHDVQTIVDLIPKLAPTNPTLRFLLAGGAPSNLSDHAKQKLRGFEDRVLLPGIVPVEEAPYYFSLMDIGLSLYPPLPDFYFSPIKLFEYMACGIPVVASAVGQQATIVKDGENGLLVDPGDLEGVAAKVQSLLDDEVLRRRLGAAARRTILEEYTWHHNAKRILDICEAVVHASRRDFVAPVSAAHREQPIACGSIQRKR